MADQDLSPETDLGGDRDLAVEIVWLADHEDPKKEQHQTLWRNFVWSFNWQS